MEIFIMWAHFISSRREIWRSNDGFQIFKESSGGKVKKIAARRLTTSSSCLFSPLTPWGGQRFGYLRDCPHTVINKEPVGLRKSCSCQLEGSAHLHDFSSGIQLWENFDFIFRFCLICDILHMNADTDGLIAYECLLKGTSSWLVSLLPSTRSPVAHLGLGFQ